MLSVWMVPVFVYCIWIGKHFSRRCKGHWSTFLFFPTVFMITAFFALLTGSHSMCWFFYLVGLWVGCIIGLIMTNLVPIEVDLVRQAIAAPGSWLLLFCLMVLCISKCAFDWLSISMPGFILQLKIISFGIKGVVTGLLYGQALSFWYRFSIADACSPSELVRGRFAFFCGMKKVSHAEDLQCCSYGIMKI